VPHVSLVMEHGRSADDFDELSQQLRQLSALVAEQQVTLAQQQATIAAQQEALSHAQEQLTLLKKALFSPRRERYIPSPDQKLLFVAATVDAPPDKTEPASSAVLSKSKSKHHRRFVIPAFLPEQRIEHPLPEQERPCGCCGKQRVVIREHVTRQIELTRAQAHVEVHVRYTYVCQHCRRGDQVITTSKPPAPIDKSPFGTSLLAWIISAKFERHLPTYRHQEMLLEPLGMWLSRPLLCQLLKGCARALKPLAQRLLQEILISYVVQADETPVRYLGGAPGKASLGYLFGYGGDAEHPFLWYDFRPSRNRDGPSEVLATYQGVLQTDGYAVYESLVNEAPGRLRAAGCWMHARRGFDEARYTTSHPVLEETLARIQLLYDIEDRAKELTAVQRHALRRMESRPIVDRLFARWQEVRSELRPTSKLAEAIGYALNRPAALQRFLEDGRIELDTGHLERSLRGPVLGRRNYLFFGSLQGGRTAAILYSVVQSARLHRLDVTAYLTDVLRRLPALAPTDAAAIGELLPDRWGKTHPKRVLLPRLEESRAVAEQRRQRRAARRLLTQV
jgi:transposase